MPRLSKIGAAALAAFGWTSGASAVSASYLVVAGGGGGAGAVGGGGGAGGLQSGTVSLNPTLSYTVIVGAGGAGIPANTDIAGNQGNNSSFSTITANAGGKGGGQNVATDTSGGSTGGAGGFGTRTGTASQGNLGGTTGWSGAGGGGNSAVGADTPNSNANGGAGGAGTANSISGSSVTYAGGGGGGSYRLTGGAGGSGGGGAGGTFSGTPGVSGTANTGGGGGGGSDNGSGSSSGAGGSGVVIISYASPQKFGGGIVTTSGANTIHTFQTSGTLSPLSTLSASYLIVAGGGAGGGNAFNGGGGGGGLLSGSGIVIDTNSIYVVTVGAGGVGASSSVGTQGGNSVFSAYATSAVGGGIGGSGANGAGGNGGSGGGGAGGSSGTSTAGTGTSGQGNNGGTGIGGGSGTWGAGGGGGAGAVGGNGAIRTGGNGGAGSASSISGTSTTYAGGGGGAADGPTGSGTAGSGGSGGGGAGSASSSATSGTANLGGGGGGAYATNAGGSGGSGIVIISYAGSTQQMAGGTVTITGGNVIHTFTSSGYLTPLTLVGNSLRFRSSASAYLNRTPTVAGNRKTWTWSAWVKRGSLTSNQFLLSTGAAGSSDASIYFTSVDFFKFEDRAGTSVATAAVYRDPAAWYHLVVALDTTQATASNRVKLYVNGSQITAFDGAPSYPTQNADLYINNTTLHYIGRRSDGLYFDGEQTEVRLIDGQQLTPNSFGTFNSYGVWQPITYGGSYGTNGFYLPFSQGGSTYAGSFNGSSQYLSLASNAAFGYGTGDFTIEFWLYMNDVTSNQTPYDQRNGGGTSNVPTLYLGSGTMKYLVDGSNQITSGTLTTNNWFHVALSRTGTSTKLFINGTQAGSTYSDSHNYVASPIRIGNSNDGIATAWVNGYISNVRVVKGTALYTSNFVPPTSALTAISNTQLLTLQNATIVDNSTNAFSITNTGSVTTATNKIVFANPTSLSVDNGPAGNNWTPNNISNTTGSTYDSMTDVPTLTSATAANTCTWNPLASTSYNTLSNGNLTVYGNTSANNGNTASTFAMINGFWYAEMTVQSPAISVYPGFGITLTTNTQTLANGGAGTNQIGYAPSSVSYNNNGDKAVSGSTSAYGASYTNGDVIGIAVDATNGAVYYSKNGTFQGGGVPTSGASKTGAAYTWTGNTVNYSFATSQYNGSQASFNFGQQPWIYTPPSGFLALNTYNL
jgi:hypothetical protein